MRILELFSGTGSVGKVFKAHGWEVVSVDIMKKFKPDYCIDILELDYKSLGGFDVVWASPPCNTFSAIYGSFGKYGPERIKRDMEEIGLPLLLKAREIINYIKPTWWFIENPQTGRMKNYIKDLPFIDVDYCQYGYAYRKRTRIWTNLSFDGKKCKCKAKHSVTIGAWENRVSKNNRYSIPEPLISDILLSITAKLDPPVVH